MVLDSHFRILFLHQGKFLLGEHGVQLFFVLSGFLITSQLIAQKSPNLKAFYIRRAFRILPVVICYLSVLLLILFLFRRPFVGSGIVSSALFFRNYVSSITPAGSLTGQFWSLSVEEQFYLFWPMLIFFFRRKAVWVAAAVVVISDAL